jgi:hypothetical protein
MHTDFRSKFQEREYDAFKDTVVKCANDTGMVIKQNNIIFGKSKVAVPSFVNIEKLREFLLVQKRTLLMQYDDLYQKVLSSERPEAFKKEYEAVVASINELDDMLKDADEVVDERNNDYVLAPVEELHTKIVTNQSSSESILRTMDEGIHVDLQKIKKVMKLHKDNMSLYQQLAEAKSVPDIDYLIWEDAVKTQTKSVKASNQLKREKSAKVMKGGRLNEQQKNAIKNQVKKIMVEKLT